MSGTEFEGYEALVSELRSTPPVAPERLRERVLELEPGARQRMSKRRRLTFVVVPVAVVLAVGAALVHGLVNSGSNRSRADGAALTGAALRLAQGQATTTPSVAHGKAAAPATAKRVFGPTPLKTYAEGAPHNAARYNLSLDQIARGAVKIPTNRLVHADASLQVSVKSHDALSKATNDATQIVASLGGYAQSVNYQSGHGGQGDAVLQLRVPVQKAQIAIGRLADLGTLLSQQVSTKDLQQQLTSQNNGIGSLKRAIAVYEQALKS